MTDKANKTDDKIIQEAVERFKHCEEMEQENREQALEDLKFSLGDQWDDKIRRWRESDPNGARPCLTVDKVGQYVRQVTNDARQNRPSVKVRPVDDGSDPQVAEILQGWVRHTENNSNADIAYDIGGEMAVRAGFGFIRVITQYEGDETFDIEAAIKAVPNPFSCYLEPEDSSLDGSEARYGFFFDDMPRSKFEDEYPGADPVDFEDSRFKEVGWAKKDVVRVAEYFRVETEHYDIWQDEDGKISTVKLEGRPHRKACRRKVMWYKLTAAEILDRREFPSKYIPIVPIYGHVIDVAGERKITSLVHPGLDAQRIHNYSVSSLVERVALVPKAPYVAAAGQIEAYRDEWESANTSNVSVLTYDPVDLMGQAVPPPQRTMGADVPQGWLQIVQMTEHDIQSAFGMYNASLGAPSNERTGKAIMARQREADTATFHFPDNVSRAIRQIGRILVDMAPRILDTKRVVRILGEDDTPGTAILRPGLGHPVVERRSAVDGKLIEKIYDITVGKYDVTVQAGPSFGTKRQEAADFMNQAIQTHPELLQVIGDLMFKAMDMPYSDKIAKRLEAMIPQNIKDAEKGEQDPSQNPIPPQAEQAMQAAAAQIEQMQQALQQAHDQIQKLSEAADKTANEAEKLKLEARKVDIEEFQAETERMSTEVQNLIALQQADGENAEGTENGPAEESETQEQQILMTVMQRLEQIAQQLAQPQQLQQPVQVFVDGTQRPMIKRAKAVKVNGEWIMESVEEPTQNHEESEITQ